MAVQRFVCVCERDAIFRAFPSHFSLHPECSSRTQTCAEKKRRIARSKLISYFTDDSRWEHGRVVTPAMLAIYDARTLYLHLHVDVLDEHIIVD